MQMRAREEEQKARENEEKIKTERIKKSERSAKLGKSLIIKKKDIRAINRLGLKLLLLIVTLFLNLSSATEQNDDIGSVLNTK